MTITQRILLGGFVVLSGAVLTWGQTAAPDTPSVSSAGAPARAPDSVSSGAEEKEAMELGGVVTVDAAADPADVQGGSVEIGTVELSATVNIAQGLTAAISILAEGNLSALSIDQAVVEWAPEQRPFAFLFGQQTLNHGLLSTRLISDPVMLDAVETSGPSLVGNLAFGKLTPGVALTYLHQEAVVSDTFILNLTDSTITRAELLETPERHHLGGVINVDLSFGEESSARLSARYLADALDVDLGAGFVFGALIVDAEVFATLLGKDGLRPAGYYAGLSYAVGEHFQPAIRYDGFSGDLFTDLTHRVGIGATVSFAYGIFAAAEYGLTVGGNGDSSHEVALQIGLEQTLKLPGFQRKTLTNE